MTSVALGPARGMVRWSRRTVDSLRAQAPGARMVGEMAVRVTRSEIVRRLQDGGKGRAE